MSSTECTTSNHKVVIITDDYDEEVKKHWDADFFLFTDAQYELLPSAIETMIEAFKNDYIGIVYSNGRSDHVIYSEPYNRIRLEQTNIIVGPVMISKDAMRIWNTYSPDMYLKMTTQYIAIHIPQILWQQNDKAYNNS